MVSYLKLLLRWRVYGSEKRKNQGWAVVLKRVFAWRTFLIPGELGKEDSGVATTGGPQTNGW